MCGAISRVIVGSPNFTPREDVGAAEEDAVGGYVAYMVVTTLDLTGMTHLIDGSM